jgi:hypothetical protein
LVTREDLRNRLWPGATADDFDPKNRSVTDPRAFCQKSNGAPTVSVRTNLGFGRGGALISPGVPYSVPPCMSVCCSESEARGYGFPSDRGATAPCGTVTVRRTSPGIESPAGQPPQLISMEGPAAITAKSKDDGDARKMPMTLAEYHPVGVHDVCCAHQRELILSSVVAGEIVLPAARGKQHIEISVALKIRRHTRCDRR